MNTIALLIAIWIQAFPFYPDSSGMAPLTFEPFWGSTYSTAPDDIRYPGTAPGYPATGAFCTNSGGWFAVNLQLSMAPSSDATGQIIIKNLDGNRKFFVLNWASSAKQYVANGNTVIIHTIPNECFRLVYTSTGYAYVNPDPTATMLTIYKLGA